jgi:beta-galactosidase
LNDAMILLSLAATLASLLIATPVSSADSPDRQLDRLHPAAISLSGKWSFRLDPDSVGKRDRWFSADTTFPEHIQVPGCWDAQGKGTPGAITTVANADDTQPHVRAISAYNGEAWYKRTFRVPESWRGRVVWLNVGGVNDRAEVWVNGRPAGAHDGYCTGFKLDITDLVSPGSASDCTILVSNAPRPEGNLEGCFDFYTNWGGIYRDVWLESTAATWIDRLRATPELASSAVRVHARVMGKHRIDQDMTVRFSVIASGGKKAIAVLDKQLPRGSDSAEIEASIPVKDAKLWSPESPYLYRVRVQLLSGAQVVDSVVDRFGMRDIRIEGKHILLNGKRIFLRGYGTDGIYPLTISPPASKEFYLHELGAARSYGFNFARQHTWIPLPEHLDAADEVGMLVQMEMPTGLHPIDKPTPFLEKLWRDELGRVLEANADHPSWIILSMGNELGDALKDAHAQKTYYGLTKMARNLDPSRIVIVTSGSTTPLPAEEPFYSRGIYGIEPLVSPAKGIAGWVAGHDRPYVWHEMGYYASYPNPELRAKYKGGMIPFWLDEAIRVAKEKGFLDRLPTYVRNSVRLQQICLKWHMELARKVPELAGFEWWTFKDNSWPTEGITDDFTDHKPGVDVEAVRRLNSDTVLLLEEEPRTARAGEKLRVNAEVSHFASQPFRTATLRWELRSGSEAVEHGSVPGLDVDVYGLSSLASLELTMPSPSAPAKYMLHLELSEGRRGIENEWPVWVFPKARQLPAKAAIYDPTNRLGSPFGVLRIDSIDKADDVSVLISTALSKEVIDFADRGGRVLLISRKSLTGLAERECAHDSPDIPYPLYFAPTYWGAPYAPGGGNLGTVISNSKALGSFPHEGFCDLQFLDLLHGVARADLDALPVRIEPIIRSITDWRLGANAAYLYEARVGKGALLVTTLNFEQTLAENRPEAEWLLQEMADYCASDAFDPQVALPVDWLRKR